MTAILHITKTICSIHGVGGLIVLADVYVSGFDFRSIFECESDVVLAVDGSVVNQGVPGVFVEFCQKLLSGAECLLEVGDPDCDTHKARKNAFEFHDKRWHGYGDGTFGPDRDITREELAAVMYRYAGYKGEDISVSGVISGYADADAVSDYAVTAIEWAIGAGLINGNDDNTLKPQGGATRAEAAAILTRFIEG